MNAAAIVGFMVGGGLGLGLGETWGLKCGGLLLAAGVGAVIGTLFVVTVASQAAS